MRKLSFIMCAAFLSIATICTSASAANIKEFYVSGSSSLSSTGFSTDADARAYSVQVGTDESGDNVYAVKLAGDGTNGALILNNQWSSSSIDDNLIFETKFMAGSVDSASTLSLYFRTGDSSRPYLTPFEVKGDKFYCCGALVDDFVIEANKWYDLIIVMRKNPDFKVEIYSGSEKIASQSEPKIDSFDQYYSETPQMRIQSSKSGVYYIGDSRIYQTDPLGVRVKDSVLPSVSSPVELEFVSAPDADSDYAPVYMDADTVIADNISITDVDGNVMEASDYSFAPVYDESGKWVTGAIVSFNAPLAEDYEYAISFNKTNKGVTAVTDFMGRGVSDGYITVAFETKAPQTAYNWNGGAKLYSGCGDAKTPATNVTNGKNTVVLTAENNGNRPRPVTFVAVLYHGDKLVDMQFVTCDLQRKEKTDLSLTFDVTNCSSDTKIKTMIWKEAMGKALANPTTFIGEGA